MYRIGNGFDVHRLVIDRKLILGGIDIPFEKGLLGHSDADVLIHAIIDSLLGAAGLGVIGQYFPDNDTKYKDISGLVLLKRTYELIKNYEIQNIDTTILAEQPKLQSYFLEMKNCIAKELKIDRNQINIKATTTEKLGYIGRCEGIAAMAIALLKRL